MIFKYSKLLPIRLIEIKTFDQRYQNKPFDLDDRQCYVQKFQTNDTTKLQFLSDYPDFTFKIYHLDTNIQALNIDPVDKQYNVKNQTFKVYEVEIDFNQLLEGDYYVEVIANGVLYQSEPINVAGFQPNTLLYEYRNSYPKSDTIFYDGFVSSFRVEGGINQFMPSFQDESYIDQQYNNTLLNSVGYRIFTLYVGNATGVPDWVGDRINEILTCDNLKIDGLYYAKANSAKWNINRAGAVQENEKTFAGYSIEITPVSNIGENVYIVEAKKPEDEIRMIQLSKVYQNHGGDLTAIGLFKKYSILVGIGIYPGAGTAPFTITAGITSNGGEIGTFTVEDVEYWLRDYLFDGVRTLYLTGLDSVTCDIVLDYKQYDAPALNGTINPFKGLGIGSRISYCELNPGDLDRDFTLSSGLGNTGTDWVDWAICGIYKGTEQYAGGRLILGYTETTYPLTIPVNGIAVPNTGGVNTFKLTKKQLPIDSIKIFAAGTKSDESDGLTSTSLIANSGQFGASRASYAMVAGSPGSPFVGNSEPMGEGADIPIMPQYVVELMVVRYAKTA